MTTIPTLTERLEAATVKAEGASGIMHDVANGGPLIEVPTESGPVPSIAKWFADLNDRTSGAVGQVADDLDAEVQAREQAVTAEAQAREQADQALAQSVLDEADERDQADRALAASISELSGTLPVLGAAYYYGNSALLDHTGAKFQRVDVVVPYSPDRHELSLIPAAARQYVRQAVSGSVGNFASGMHDGVSWLAFGPSGIYRSIDRVTWELVSTVLPGGYGRLAGDGALGIHCAISGNGTGVYRSADNMQSWSVALAFSGSTIYDICCSGSIFIAVGELGRIASSPTGQTWTDRGPNTTGDFRRCVWTGEFFIAYRRTSGEVWKSIDGISWSMSAAGIGTAFAEICTFGGVTYLVSASQISYSSDGVSWVTKSHPAVAATRVSHAGGRIIVLSASNPSRIYSSADNGDSWQEEQYLYSPLLNFITGRRDEDVSLLLGASGFIGDISSFADPATIRFSQASAVGNFNLYTRTK